MGEPATPAKPGAVEIAAAPATARRGRPRDEDQPAPADSHAEGQAAEQPDSQGEQDEQAPAKRRKVAPQDPAAGRALGSVGTWRRGEAAERRKAAEAAEQAAREQRYREAFEKYQSVGAELRSLEDKRVTRVKAAQEEAEERDERLVRWWPPLSCCPACHALQPLPACCHASKHSHVPKSSAKLPSA